MPQNRFNIIFERFKTHDITDYRELAYFFFGVAAAEEALLDEQAPPESDVAGNTVMTFAAACGRVKTIELLLRYGAKVDATNKCGNQPVPPRLRPKTRSISLLRSPRTSATRRHALLVAEGGVDARATTKVGQTESLFSCPGYGDAFDVLFSEERGRTLGGPASIAVADESGATPLHLAAEHGHAKVCVRLLDLGAARTPATARARRPLHGLPGGPRVRRRRAARARRGLSTGPCRPRPPGRPGPGRATTARRSWTRGGPVHVACQEGHGDVLTLLLDAGADAEAPGEKRATPVHYATENGHAGVVRLLRALKGALDPPRGVGRRQHAPPRGGGAGPPRARQVPRRRGWRGPGGRRAGRADAAPGRVPPGPRRRRRRARGAGANLKAADGAGRGAAAVAAGHPKVLRAPARRRRSNVALGAGRLRQVRQGARAEALRQVQEGPLLFPALPDGPLGDAQARVRGRARQGAAEGAAAAGDESESEEEDTRPRDMRGEIDRRPPEDTTRMIGV
ncbi:spectrin binding protein [Aureococcus anophagefferens]|uniref:Spectrin binding protein n=1 Tax=Aureococcus anophagefferens TaxID=44056 RepID=A0ABR1FIU7_AURAN